MLQPKTTNVEYEGQSLTIRELYASEFREVRALPTPEDQNDYLINKCVTLHGKPLDLATLSFSAYLFLVQQVSNFILPDDAKKNG